MPNEKTLDSNNGAANAAGNGQPADDDNKDVNALETEVDSFLKEPDEADDDDETVVITKKQQKVYENHSKGLLGIKPKLAALKKGKAQAPAQGSQEKKTLSDDAPITRADLHKINSEKAIANACKDADINDNWSEVVKYYSPLSGKDTPEAIEKDIKRAYTLFRAENPKKAEDGEDEEAKAKLAGESGKPEGGNKTGGKEKKGGLLPKKTKAQGWF